MVPAANPVPKHNKGFGNDRTKIACYGLMLGVDRFPKTFLLRLASENAGMLASHALIASESRH